MFAANTTKRAGSTGPCDGVSSPDLKTTVSNFNGAGDTKEVWPTDATSNFKTLGSKEEARKRSSRMRYLSILGAFLTTMLVGGVVRNIIPRFLHETGIIDQVDAYLGFKDGRLGIYSRSNTRHLLEIMESMPECSTVKEGRRLLRDPKTFSASEGTDPTKDGALFSHRPSHRRVPKILHTSAEKSSVNHCLEDCQHPKFLHILKDTDSNSQGRALYQARA